MKPCRRRLGLRPHSFGPPIAAPGRPRFDAVVMVNVLEHIQDDAACLTQLHRAIHPGGKLLLFVPAMEFLFSKLDQEFGRTYKDGKKIRAHHLFGIIGAMFSTLMWSRRS